jgi:hypothetical protein
MPTNRSFVRRSSRGALTDEQELTLQYGPDPRWDAFRTEAEYRDAWVRNRDRFLDRYRRGRRPMAWWRFEAGDLRYPGYDRERSVLYASGHLDEDEAAALVTQWREEFEKAQAPDFWLCTGPGTLLHGSAARRAHYRWADIPHVLLMKWRSQRRRRPVVEPQVEGCPT